MPDSENDQKPFKSEILEGPRKVFVSPQEARMAPWIRMATSKHDLLKRAVTTRAALEPTDRKPPHQLTSAQCRVKTQAPPGIDCEDDKSVLCK